jgi:hypothetical protein
MGIGVSFPEGKATGAWSWPPPSSAEAKECLELYLHSPSTPSWHRHSFTFTFITYKANKRRMQYAS